MADTSVTPLEAAAREIAKASYAEHGCSPNSECFRTNEFCGCHQTARAALTAAIEALPDNLLVTLTSERNDGWVRIMGTTQSWDEASKVFREYELGLLRRALLGET